MKREHIFYDFEVFPKLWTVTFINLEAHEETVIVNDKDQLEQFYHKHKSCIYVGFNCRDYDQWIYKAILCGFNPKEMSDWIIQKAYDDNGNEIRRRGYDFSDVTRRNYPIRQYDVYKSNDKGLKTMEGYMGNDIRECSIPFDYDGEFTPEMIAEVLKYNRHDVEQTMYVFMHRIDAYNAQVNLLDTFGLSIDHIGKTQAQLAAQILGAVRTYHDDEWDIRLPHTLQLDRYRYVAEWYMNPRNHNKDSELITEVGGVEHLFAWGGLHGAIPKYNYTCKDGEVLLMADVDQLYPSIMIYYNLLSRAVHEPEKFRNILDTSLRLKREGKKKERQPYKDVCNITYGAMGDKANNMYDPRNRALVCIFGQLLILDLLEKIESFVDIIQSNTDGILVKLKREDRWRFDAILKAWEQRTMLNLSFEEFKKVYQKDVSTYIAVDYNGKYKSKGGWVKDLDILDYDLPIVNRAVKEYILHGTHPYKTVMECDDFIQFQKLVKVSDKFLYGIKNATFSNVKVLGANGKKKTVRMWNGDGEKLNDKTFRIFASNRPEDGGLHRKKAGKHNPMKFGDTPEKCFIWNEAINGVAIPPYLDKSWYVELALNRIKEFGVLS